MSLLEPDARDTIKEMEAIRRSGGLSKSDHMAGVNGAVLMSIAISLKRIADVAEQFGDHPDNRNEYGESGIKALMGELRRFKNEVLNDVAAMGRASR